MPKVSVVMSVCNSEPFIRDAINSILGQTFQDFEFIIINDGSTDGSLQIIQSYGDSRIRITSQENLGLTKSLNKGIGIARGEYIARQDADDISEPSRLEKQVAVLEQNSRAVLVSSNIRYFSEAWTSSPESNRHIDPIVASIAVKSLISNVGRP